MTDPFDITTAFTPIVISPKTLSRVYSRTYCPPITKVIDNNPTTIVMFNDGSKSIVKCSSDDIYNLETAILYAIVKRTFGEVDPATAEARCLGLGNSLKKIVNELTISGKTKNGTLTGKCNSSKKAEERESAFPESPCKKHFSSGRSKSDAPARKCNSSKIAALLNEIKSRGSKEYVRPNKPFSEFTQDEKRAYWRWQKRKCK